MCTKIFFNIFLYKNPGLTYKYDVIGEHDRERETGQANNITMCNLFHVITK